MDRYRQASAFRNDYGKVNLSKDNSSLTVNEDKAILTGEQSNKLQKKPFFDTGLGKAVKYAISISAVSIAMLLFVYVTTPDFIVPHEALIASIKTTGISTGDVVIIGNKFTQQERRGLSHVTAYYFELLKINADGTTKSYNTSVPFDVYTKVEVGQKFIYDENGEMQPYKEG